MLRTAAPRPDSVDHPPLSTSCTTTPERAAAPVTKLGMRLFATSQAQPASRQAPRTKRCEAGNVNIGAPGFPRSCDSYCVRDAALRHVRGNVAERVVHL